MNSKLNHGTMNRTMDEPIMHASRKQPAVLRASRGQASGPCHAGLIIIM